ncbi:hypothetical protein BJV82DRAFT_587264 [Fennellomyces sp. T-0311]|nr:hypothetical protein BJV82DRAFT_587264 [Fennellomyces sp. T-0311]
MKVIASLLLLAIGAIAELVPISPFPGKGVLISRGPRGGPPSAVVANKIYVFGGAYDLPYVVDPSDFDNPFGRRHASFNVSSEVYSYNMDIDQWEREETATPHPLKRGTTQVVGDAIYFLDTNFDSNTTRRIDVWKYSTADQTWDQVTRLNFAWHGSIKTCERDGKIYITGSEDGIQVSIIHIYDTVSNTWLDPIMVNDQLRIREIWCLDNGLLMTLAEPVRKQHDEVTIFSNEGRTPARRMNIYTIHTDGSVTQSELFIECHSLQRVAIKDGVLYTLDLDHDQMVISSTDLTSHEKHELGRIDSQAHKPVFVPYGGAVFLFGGRPYPRRPRSEDQIRTFSHKYVFGNKFNIQN